MDGAVEHLSESDTATEIQSLELLREFHESDTAVGLPKNQVLPLGLNAGHM